MLKSSVGLAKNRLIYGEWGRGGLGGMAGAVCESNAPCNLIRSDGICPGSQYGSIAFFIAPHPERAESPSMRVIGISRQSFCVAVRGRLSN